MSFLRGWKLGARNFSGTTSRYKTGSGEALIPSVLWHFNLCQEFLLVALPRPNSVNQSPQRKKKAEEECSYLEMRDGIVCGRTSWYEEWKRNDLLSTSKNWRYSCSCRYDSLSLHFQTFLFGPLCCVCVCVFCEGVGVGSVFVLECLFVQFSVLVRCRFVLLEM